MQTLMILSSVGAQCTNRSQDVKAVHECLMNIGKIPCYSCNGAFDETILNGIKAVQRHFMGKPDGAISVGGRTHGFLSGWESKPIAAGVKLPGPLTDAWEWVNPILPRRSYCSSGYRSIEDQRRILHKFYLEDYQDEIIGKYGEDTYNKVKADLLAHEQQVLKMVNGVGQAVAAPGKSMHQRGKAVDIGGPSSIDDKQIAIVKLVARAHPELFSGKVIKERNGCVHFEIR